MGSHCRAVSAPNRISRTNERQLPVSRVRLATAAVPSRLTSRSEPGCPQALPHGVRQSPYIMVDDENSQEPQSFTGSSPSDSTYEAFTSIHPEDLSTFVAAEALQ